MDMSHHTPRRRASAWITMALLVATALTPISLARGVHVTAVRPAFAHAAIVRVTTSRSHAGIAVPSTEPGELPDQRELTACDAVPTRVVRIAPARPARRPVPPLLSGDSSILRI